MINELYSLAGSLSDANISIKEFHRQLKELPKVGEKTPCFHIWIAKDGNIANIEEMSQELCRVLRKYEPNNGYSFPGFNLAPLYVFPKGTDKKETEKIKKEKTDKIRSWINNNQLFEFSAAKELYAQGRNEWNVTDKNKIGGCLKKVPEVITTPQVDNSLQQLIAILKDLTVDQFRSNLESYIFKQLEGGNNLKVLLRFLFADKQSQVYFDFYDWQTFGYPVAHERTIAQLNTILQNSVTVTERKIKDSDTGQQDAFADLYVPNNDKMPNVKLAGFDVTLRSMFDAHKCQYRYNTIESESYPINEENRKKIKSALEWLKDAEREEQTWTKADKDEIVFIYPSTLSSIPVKYARVLKPKAGMEGVQSAKRFVNIANDVAKTFKGLPSKEKPDNIRIFAIRKMDKARSKVIFSRNYTPEHLFDSADDWQRGCENIPSVKFRVWGDEKKKQESDSKEKEKKAPPIFIEQETPMPLQIAHIINRIWKMSGESAGEVKRIQHYQGVELLLEKEQNELLAYILRIMLSNTLGLFLYLGNTLHSNKALSAKMGQDTCSILPILGLLLYKRQITKEVYMENTPYLIGQLLKVSDELHTLYCKIVRQDDVPPILAGASVFVTATETPCQALSQLGKRVKPYIDWAKQYRTKNVEEKGKESWLAGWYLKLYEVTASRLQLEPVTRFNDFEKAQVFIGYLAAFPKKEEDNSSTEPREDDKILPQNN
jgi:hypothetical protein